MNNSYNYADFVGLCLTSDDEFEPYGYQHEAHNQSNNPQDASIESRIETLLLDHSKYYIYCE